MMNPPGKTIFHVVADDIKRQFSLDGHGGRNGIRLHLEVQAASRSLVRKLQDFNLSGESQEAVIAQMAKMFPGYKFVGNWANLNSN